MGSTGGAGRSIKPQPRRMQLLHKKQAHTHQTKTHGGDYGWGPNRNTPNPHERPATVRNNPQSTRSVPRNLSGNPYSLIRTIRKSRKLLGGGPRATPLRHSRSEARTTRQRHCHPTTTGAQKKKKAIPKKRAESSRTAHQPSPPSQCPPPASRTGPQRPPRS